jgi:hypothetical protein
MTPTCSVCGKPVAWAYPPGGLPRYLVHIPAERGHVPVESTPVAKDPKR